MPVIDPVVLRSLRCRHGCDGAIVGLYHFPDGCVCFDDPVQALCAQHALRARYNVTHGAMVCVLSFREGEP